MTTVPGSSSASAARPFGPTGHDDDGGADRVQHTGEPVAQARRRPGDDGDPAVESELGERIECGARVVGVVMRRI